MLASSFMGGFHGPRLASGRIARAEFAGEGSSYATAFRLGKGDWKGRKNQMQYRILRAVQPFPRTRLCGSVPPGSPTRGGTALLFRQHVRLGPAVVPVKQRP